MTIIPAEHRFNEVRERRKLKLAFTRSIEREDRKAEPWHDISPSDGDAA